MSQCLWLLHRFQCHNWFLNMFVICIVVFKSVRYHMFYLIKGMNILQHRVDGSICMLFKRQFVINVYTQIIYWVLYTTCFIWSKIWKYVNSELITISAWVLKDDFSSMCTPKLFTESTRLIIVMMNKLSLNSSDTSLFAVWYIEYYVLSLFRVIFFAKNHSFTLYELCFKSSCTTLTSWFLKNRVVSSANNRIWHSSPTQCGKSST